MLFRSYDMLESIKKEVKGDLENAFLNLGKQVWPPPSLVDISFQSASCAEAEVTNGRPVNSSGFGRHGFFT